MTFSRLCIFFLLPLGSFATDNVLRKRHLVVAKPGQGTEPRPYSDGGPAESMTSPGSQGGGGSVGSGNPNTNGQGGGQNCGDVIADWHDSDSKYYNCDWYAISNYCHVYGDDYAGVGGLTAKENCCVCGGGTECHDHNWKDSDDLGCDWYAQEGRCWGYGDDYQNNGKTANDACCACGGGRRPTRCEDLSGGKIPSNGWYDKDGRKYNCNWYSKGNRCAAYGDSYENFGYTANQACCACGGGQ